MTAFTNDRSSTPRFDRWLVAIGLGGLAAIAAAYWLTVEPAPRIRIQWRQDISAPQRARLEEKYLLVNARDPIENGSLAYDLLDTSRANIRAIVEERTIADTHDIDRDLLTVPFEVDYGIKWMWVAHRIPLLRQGRARAALMAGLALLVMVGFLRRRTPALRPWRRSSSPSR